MSTDHGDSRSTGNKHGGKRAGAGRKPALDFPQKLAIGQYCERRATEARKEARDARMSEYLQNHAERNLETLQADWAALQAIPLQDRPAVLHGALEADPEGPASDLVNIRSTLDHGPRLSATPNTRTPRRAIIEDAQRRFQEKYQKSISYEVVRRCWLLANSLKEMENNHD